MAVQISDTFNSLAAGGLLTSRALDNGNGGSGSYTWTDINDFFGATGGGRVSGADQLARMSVVFANGNYKARVKFDPAGGTSNLCLWGNRTAAGASNYIVAIVNSTHTKLQLREGSAVTPPSGGSFVVDLTITAPGTTFWLELEINGLTATARILNSDLSVRNTGSHTFASIPSGDRWGFGFANAGSTGVFDDFIIEDLAAPDTTAPTLTGATGTATGSTTASGSVTTDEANGTLYRLASTNATETAATVIAAALSQSVTATGAQAVSFTGLTASTTYYAHYVHVDAAANESTRVSSASFTTDTPDTTAPTLSSPTATALSNALIAAGVTTNEANGTLYVVATTSATPPTATQIRAGQDHTGAAAVFDDSQVISSTGAKTFNVTGLTQLTLYYLYFHHQDAAANNSTVSSASATTFRNGATAQSVIDNTAAVGGNPAGVLYALALTIDPDDWMAYREIAAPDPAGGTLTANANGSFTYVGPEPADWIIQPEVNGVDHADGTITVALYQTIVEDTTAPTLTSPTGAALGSAGAAGSVSTNEANGTLYWLTTINATETDAAIKAGSSQAVTATGVQYVTSSGLTASTTYYNHFLHRDAAGNDSARSTSASFATSAAPTGGGPQGSKVVAQIVQPICRPIVRPMT